MDTLCNGNNSTVLTIYTADTLCNGNTSTVLTIYTANKEP